MEKNPSRNKFKMVDSEFIVISLSIHIRMLGREIMMLSIMKKMD
jgi:hypothetical protein